MSAKERPLSKPKKWTPQEQNLAEKMMSEGATYRQVALALGRCHKTIRYHLPGRVPSGSLRNKRYKWTVEDEAEAARLRKIGKTHKQIAAVLGKTPRAVESKFWRMDGKWPEATREKLFIYHSRGYSPEQIARKMKRPIRAITTVIAMQRKKTLQDPRRRRVLQVINLCAGQRSMKAGDVLSALRRSKILDHLDRQEAIDS